MIKAAKNDDCNTLAELAIQMRNSSTAAELAEEFSKAINSKSAVCFIKYTDNIPVGFAQCGLRNDYVEGTESSPVGYLEGIFVKEEHRNRGYAKELLTACEEWSKTMGCTEFASDCELSNSGSLNFHIAMGFHEANRIICFTKRI